MAMLRNRKTTMVCMRDRKQTSETRQRKDITYSEGNLAEKKKKKKSPLNWRVPREYYRVHGNWKSGKYSVPLPGSCPVVLSVIRSFRDLIKTRHMKQKQ